MFKRETSFNFSCQFVISEKGFVAETVPTRLYDYLLLPEEKLETLRNSKLISDIIICPP
jgi:hypothetical protein